MDFEVISEQSMFWSNLNSFGIKITLVRSYVKFS